MADPSAGARPPARLQVLNGTLFAASTGRIDDRWRSFMQFQIARARQVRSGVDPCACPKRADLHSAAVPLLFCALPSCPLLTPATPAHPPLSAAGI